MNLVFSSLFLFILISPGLLFRFSYLQGSYAKVSFKVSAVEEILWALIPALLLQSVGVWVVENLYGQSLRLDVIYQLIIAESTDFTVVKNNLILFSAYMFVLMAIAMVGGWLMRALIRKLRIDLYWKFLRFGNEWYYLLSGEILNLPEKSADEKWYTTLKNYLSALRVNKIKVELIQVDAVINSSEGDLIYSGILKDFFLSRDNGLDRIYLSNVYRRAFKNDLQDEDKNPGFLARDTDERYYTMPGDFFVITYDKMVNLNLTYYLQNNAAESADDESTPES